MIEPGDSKAWRQWQAALAGDRMHHAWLLSGPRGSGKGAFAIAAARALVQADGEAMHPDILHVTHLPKDDKEADKRAKGEAFESSRNIGIAQIRELQQRLTTKPSVGGTRAVIVEPADDMERGAANALLKSLEEPPQGTVFLLVAHRAGRLLPTIRSRCRVLRLAPPDAQRVAAWLRERAPEVPADEIDAAIAAADGVPGVALSFIELGLARMDATMREIAATGDPDQALRARLTDRMGQRPSREKQLAMIELARAVLADRTRRTPRQAIPALVDAHSALVRLAAQAPTYNFDAGMLVMEIGTLLAGVAGDRETA